MWFHLPLRAKRLQVPLTDPRLAPALWRALRRGFLVVAGTALMPTHLHMLAWEASPEAARDRLARVRSGLSRSPHLEALLPEWEKIELPSPTPDPRMLARQVRYLALNPCRDHHIADPLCWPWSTHRDVMGAVVDPWVRPEDLARALEWGAQGFQAAFHKYVSGDPSANLSGTPPPRPFQAEFGWDAPSLERVLAAALAATRSAPEAVRRRSPARRLFLQLAWEVGQRNTAALARICGITPWAVYPNTARRDPDALAAGLLCLGDERLWAAGMPSQSPHSTRRPAERQGPRGQ